MQIYRQQTAAEETRTGLPSKRPDAVDFAHALADPGTNTVFIQREAPDTVHRVPRVAEYAFAATDLISLRKATSSFLRGLLESPIPLPYGVRYFAREVFNILRQRYATEGEHECLRVVGHLVYYRFLQPAIL